MENTNSITNAKPVTTEDLERTIERLILKTNKTKEKEYNKFIFWMIPSIFFLCVIGGFVVKMIGF